MLPSPSLNLIPVHISHPSVKLVRSSPPASGGHFFYVIVRPHHSKGNRELPIVAIWSPKRRAANKLRGKRGRQQTAARRTRGHGMARKRAGGAPKNERIGRKRMGKLASGRQALVVGAVCLAVLFLWPRLGTLGAKVPSSLVAVIVGMIDGAPIRHEREHHRRFVHHQRRLARVARTAALNRFAARPASQRRRRHKKGRWLGASPMRKAVEHNDARPPKKGVFLGRPTFAIYD